MDHSVGDVMLVPFPFADQSGAKKRPAVIVSGSGYNSHPTLPASVSYLDWKILTGAFMFASSFLDLRHRMGNTSMGKRTQTEQSASFGQRLAVKQEGDRRLRRRLLAIEKLDAAEKRKVLQLLDAFIERGQIKRKVHAAASR